jgi:hypothetical protein
MSGRIVCRFSDLDRREFEKKRSLSDRPLMIAWAKKRRAEQDKNPYCREHSESNTEYGHLLTP